MNTTREAALEAAAKNLVWAAQTSGGTAGRDEGLVAACDRMEAALSTPATEPQGYAEVTEEMVTAGRIAADDKYYKWRGLGTREEGQGLDGMHFIVREAINKALAARPAPQPAAEHEYPDPLIAEDRYEDDQPAVDTRVDLIHRMDAMQACQVGPSDEWAKATKDGYNRAATDCAFNILKIKPAIICTATPAPSDKIAEAAIDRCMQEIEDIICEADVSYPAGRDAGTSIDFDRDAVLAALRALAGKGE